MPLPSPIMYSMDLNLSKLQEMVEDREAQGQGNLVGCRLWGRTESDTTEAT